MEYTRSTQDGYEIEPIHVIDMILNFKSISLCEKERFEPLKHVYHRIMTSACF